jgi:hypothetical protein
VEDVVETPAVDQRVHDRLAGAVVHSERSALEGECSHLAGVRAELPDRVPQRGFAVVVATDRVELEVRVERPHREGRDDVPAVNDSVRPSPCPV